MNWLYAVNREFLADALWLRYDKLNRQARHTLHTLKVLSRPSREEVPSPCRRRTLPAFHSESSPQGLVLSEASKRDVKDHLTSLPYDIRLIILEFLLKPLPVPKETIEVVEDDSDGGTYCWENTYVPPRRRASHPLNQLAATSKLWRDEVEAFCGRQLIVLKQKITLGRQDDWVPWRELRTYTSCSRMELVVRLSERCAFCGIETISQSEKWPGLTCCRPCEDPYNLPEEAWKRTVKKRRRMAMAPHIRDDLYLSRLLRVDRI
jgi:hypothetical protein